MSGAGGLRAELRRVPTLTGSSEAIPWPRLPAHPRELFVEWLRDAITRSVLEPTAVTLSTVDDTGWPNARAVTLKDVTPDFALQLASGRDSAKGRELAAEARCAVSLYWPILSRAVRLRGIAAPLQAQQAAADFRNRGETARAVALAGRQSTPVVADDDIDNAVGDGVKRLRLDPSLVAETWTVWSIEVQQVEFWRGSSDRVHERAQYSRNVDGWSLQRLWP